MAAQGEERLLGAVVGGGKAVRAQPDPGKEGDQGELVEEVGVADVAGPADEDVLQPVEESVVRRNRS